LPDEEAGHGTKVERAEESREDRKNERKCGGGKAHS